MTLPEFGTAIGSLGSNVYHHFSPQGAGIPRIVWAEYDTIPLSSDNRHECRRWEISVNAYTKSEYDQLKTQLETLLDGLSVYWELDSIMYETDTHLIHYEWKVKFVEV